MKGTKTKISAILEVESESKTSNPKPKHKLKILIVVVCALIVLIASLVVTQNPIINAKLEMFISINTTNHSYAN